VKLLLNGGGEKI